MTMHTASFGGVRAPLLCLLLCLALAARADADSDWLAKVPPPPRTLDQAEAQCGEGSTYASNPWIKFEKERQAVEDKAQKDMQAGISDPNKQADMAAAMMSQNMDPASMMATQQYAQYMAGLGTSAPGVTADTLFKPAYDAADAAVDAVLKTQAAKLAKCPTLQSEAGPYPVPSCEKPIDADADKKKTDIANKYLSDSAAAWPRFIAGTQDYFKKINAVPAGIDPNLMQVKTQRLGLPLQELGAVKDVTATAAKVCENATALKSRINPGS